MKNILFIASEGVPFIKTGGLADVVGNSDRAGEPGCGQGCDADARGYGAAV